MHPDTLASLCVASAIVAGVAFFFVGFLVGQADRSGPTPPPARRMSRESLRRAVVAEVDELMREERSKREWIEGNVADLWAHVNDIEDDLPPWHPRARHRADDTDFERD